MAPKIDVKASVAHANEFWSRPCSDEIVWTKNHPILISSMYSQFGLKSKEWEAVFLLYDGPEATNEGLFFVPKEQSSASTRISRGFHAKNFPKRHFLCSWKDSVKHTYGGQTPPYTGLNDCAHFVSECLSKARINVATTSAPQLVSNLRALDYTKTLAYMTTKENAARIIKSGIMTPGDVIAFAREPEGHRHSTLYMGGEGIAMHTWASHPSHTHPLLVHHNNGVPNNWEFSSNAGHPLVTLIHFESDETSPKKETWLHGWWIVRCSGQDYFYFFDENGRVVWTKNPPKSARPPVQTDGKGYWFIKDHDLLISWRTGNFERFDSTSPEAIAGRLNDAEETIGTRFPVPR